MAISSTNYNDKIFNANDFFNNQVGLQEPRSDSHNFGGSFGGPIKKNKLFVFFNYESLQYALPKSAKVTIPSPQLQQYALAHIPAAATALYTDAFALWNNAPGAGGAVPTTNGSGPLQDGNKHLGCGTGTFWNSNTPAPGGGIFGVTVPCTYKWADNTSEKNLESVVTIKGGYNITDKEKLGVRYNHDWGLQATSPSFISPVFNSLSSQPEHQGQITLTSVIKPTLVNNFVGSSLFYSAISGVADFSKTTALMRKASAWAMADSRASARASRPAAMWDRRSWWTT